MHGLTRLCVSPERLSIPRRGELIALEGVDNSGKSTQVQLLIETLAKRNISCQLLHFPRTETPGAGEIIAMFLRGTFGKAHEVNPYLVGLMFAADRAAARGVIDDALANNEIVIIDRYFWSNVAFQRAKLNSSVEKEQFTQWIKRLELDSFALPMPKLSVFFNVPPCFARRGIEQRNISGEREYLNGVADIHENDLDLQSRVAEEYIELCEREPGILRIDCFDESGRVLRPSEIHTSLISALAAHRIICSA